VLSGPRSLSLFGASKHKVLIGPQSYSVPNNEDSLSFLKDDNHSSYVDCKSVMRAPSITVADTDYNEFDNFDHHYEDNSDDEDYVNGDELNEVLSPFKTIK